MTPSVLHLMHLVSPALPVGAYAYSQGLESAVDMGWVKTEAEICDWIQHVLVQGLGHLDAPLCARFYEAWQTKNWQALNTWNDFARASRETHELLLEDEQLGLAMQRLLVSLDVGVAEQEQFERPPCFAAQFALACVHWQIDKRDAVMGLLWAFLENQISAATKIVPWGQTQAQRCLLKLMPNIEATCDHALALQDDELGVSLTGLAIASSMHERQYSRLFRS